MVVKTTFSVELVKLLLLSYKLVVTRLELFYSPIKNDPYDCEDEVGNGVWVDFVVFIVFVF